MEYEHEWPHMNTYEWDKLYEWNTYEWNTHMEWNKGDELPVAAPFHSIPFHSIPFHFILFHSIPFYYVAPRPPQVTSCRSRSGRGAT